MALYQNPLESCVCVCWGDGREGWATGTTGIKCQSACRMKGEERKEVKDRDEEASDS